MRAIGFAPIANDAAAFQRLFLADALARVGYQIGKSPVLPVFAVTLGAGDLLLGSIVAVSTCTGLVLKPLVGLASDRWGRRGWALVAGLLFVGVPLLYRFATAPGHLVGLRLVHGLGTALFGPVTVAWVAALGAGRVAERLGWFGSARGLGYVVGPLVGGWLLTVAAPARIYDVVGLVSLPALLLLWTLPRVPVASRAPLGRQVRDAARVCRASPALWWAGGFEAGLYVALYALKTFLPVYALRHDLGLLSVGGLMALQEGVHLALRPLGGRFADRRGPWTAIALGLAAVGLALAVLPVLGHGLVVVAAFVLLGAGSAWVVPAAAALTSREVGPAHLGAGLGLVGAMRNGGKVLGPLVGGALVGTVGASRALIGLGLAVVALAWAAARRARSESA